MNTFGVNGSTRAAHRVALLVSLLLPSIVVSQSTTATLTGFITDQSKAAMADVKVDVTNMDTNLHYRTSTNVEGSYTAPELSPGVYRMELEKQGFKSIVKPDIILHVQDVIAINFTMAVGSTSESVTVEAGASPINTSDASVSTVVDRQFVENMPLNGRSFQTLITLTPGVVLTSSSLLEQGQFSVNGQRADANYFSVDGASANFGVSGVSAALYQGAGGGLPAFSALGTTSSLVSVDAMQEFRIQTSTFAPEFGNMPGAQVSIVTRSGTNSFHGNLFDYFRNDLLDANNWFADRNNLPKPEERQNDFGGTLGGPIVKDRTFFFFSYEGLRLRQPLAQSTVVPDLSSRQNAPSQIQPFLNAFPIPNGPELGSGFGQFNATYSNPASLDAYSLRLDHVFSPRFLWFARYNYSPTQTIVRGSVLSTLNRLPVNTQTFTSGLTTLLTARASNELRMNYSNQRSASFYNLDTFGGAVPPSISLLFPPGVSPSNDEFVFRITGAGSGWDVGKTTVDEQRQIDVNDKVSITVGAHQFKLGFDYLWLSPISSPFAYNTGPTFSGMTGPTGALSGSAQSAYVSSGDTSKPANEGHLKTGQWKQAGRVLYTRLWSAKARESSA